MSVCCIYSSISSSLELEKASGKIHVKPPHIFVVTAAASPVDSGKLLGKILFPWKWRKLLLNPCEASTECFDRAAASLGASGIQGYLE